MRNFRCNIQQHQHLIFFLAASLFSPQRRKDAKENINKKACFISQLTLFFAPPRLCGEKTLGTKIQQLEVNDMGRKSQAQKAACESE